MKAKMIAGHELTPGKTVKDHIHVEGTELHVPHVLLCGEQPGPTVLITAGIHNAEYVGIQAAIELSNELDVSTLRGNVVLVPLVNRSGFENRTMSRVFEDGKNLNRVFPGDREGSEAERLANMLFEVFIRNADAYIDLHCGDGYETLIPYCYYLGDTPAEETAKRMVACVNVKYVVRSHCRTGGAYNLASLHGVPSVLIERGQLSLFSREEIEADKADVRRSRVREKPKASFDIHDRVNYAVTDQTLKINTDKKVISLNLQIDTDICSMYEYFEIFLNRMLMCRGAADLLGATFKLTANGAKVL